MWWSPPFTLRLRPGQWSADVIDEVAMVLGLLHRKEKILKNGGSAWLA